MPPARSACSSSDRASAAGWRSTEGRRAGSRRLRSDNPGPPVEQGGWIYDLDGGIEVRATSKALRLHPLRDDIEEDGDELLGRRRCRLRRWPEAIDSTRAPIEEPFADEGILRGKVPIEGRLRHACPLDQHVHPGRVDATPGEELRRSFQDAVPGREWDTGRASKAAIDDAQGMETQHLDEQAGGNASRS